MGIKKLIGLHTDRHHNGARDKGCGGSWKEAGMGEAGPSLGGTMKAGDSEAGRAPGTDQPFLALGWREGPEGTGGVSLFIIATLSGC